MEYVTLNNGVRMPMLGYGTYQVGSTQASCCVGEALKLGYRLIDTAQAYGNEAGVGAAIAASGVPRDELFVVDKVWVSSYGEGRTLDSIDRSLELLGLGQVDLMLLHQPYGDYHAAYRDLERALAQGKARAIGVSNFDPVRLADLCAFASVPPAVDQVETHVFWQQREARRTMARLGVALMAWAPLAECAGGLLANPVLADVGRAHGKTRAQVALRYLLDMGAVAIPRSTRPEHIAEDIDVLDFSLTDEERARVATLDGGRPLVFDHGDAELVGSWLESISAA